MRDGSKTTRRATLAAVFASVSLPTMAAQNAPTAAGAQEFLAAMAQQIGTRVSFVDAAGRTNYVTGIYSGDVKTVKGTLLGTKEKVVPLAEKSVDKQLAEVRASVLEAIDAYGRPTPCATRITEVTAPNYDETRSDEDTDNHSFSFKFTYTNQSWKYEPLTKFMSPAQVIDWSDVSISRSYDGSVTVVSKGQSFPTLRLTYMATDLGLADRLEFAMKFLAMSCGAIANAGS